MMPWKALFWEDGISYRDPASLCSWLRLLVGQSAAFSTWADRGGRREDMQYMVKYSVTEYKPQKA
jgi:hypothetical protein